VTARHWWRILTLLTHELLLLNTSVGSELF